MTTQYRQGRPQAPHARRGRGAEARPRRASHRPRLDRVARSDPGRGLWRQHAAQPGRDGVGARAAAAVACRCGTGRNIQPVEKAIRNAGLGINPITDGQMIRLPIPDLTEERRKELAKLVGQYAEKARIAVRNVRRDGMDHLKTDEKKHEISEDERKRLEHEVQKLTDDTIKEIDDAARRQGKGNPRQVTRARRPGEAPSAGRAQRRGSPPRRDHHGRQRPLGEAARAAARRRPSRRRRGGCAGLCSAAVEARGRGPDRSTPSRRRIGGAADEEIADLTGLMRFYLERELDELDREGVRLRLIGDHEAFGPDLSTRLERRSSGPRDNSRLTLVVALNYGSRARNRRGGPGARRQGRGRRARPGGDRRGSDRGASCDTPELPDARPADPHLGRNAAVQFPAVAGGLCRTDVRRHAVAGFRRAGASPRRSREFAAARAAVRRPMSDLADSAAADRRCVLIALALVAARSRAAPSSPCCVAAGRDGRCSTNGRGMRRAAGASRWRRRRLRLCLAAGLGLAVDPRAGRLRRPRARAAHLGVHRHLGDRHRRLFRRPRDRRAASSRRRSARTRPGGPDRRDRRAPRWSAALGAC